MKIPGGSSNRVVFWALFLSGCAVAALVYVKLDKYDPLRPLPPAVRDMIVQDLVDWDEHHTEWSPDAKQGFASYGHEFAILSGVELGDGNVSFTVVDASGQPIHKETTDVYGGVPWAMGWDADDRLWLISESGAIRYWEQSEGKGWVAQVYTAGTSPQPPTFD